MATKKAAKKSSAKRAPAARKVIVRTYSAGVHFGTLVSREGREVVLRDARRVWSWQGARTLSEMSLRGVADGSRISERVGEITLTEAIEIIPCEAAAVASLESASWG
jgi:hypothetical protein